MNRINLFCLPFAGGSKYAYKGYAQYAPEYLNVIPVEIPGRGSRYKEQLLTDAVDITNDIFRTIKGMLHHPYAIYGHSMGTLLGFLLTKKIIAHGLPKPVHLFLSGAGGPAVRLNESKRYLLPKKEFIEKIKELDGSPEGILEDEAMVNFFEPILRADFQAVETFKYEKTNPFDIPMDVFIGLDEKATYEDALAWREETTSDVYVREFSGKHFFIYKHEQEIMSIILNKLNLKTHAI
jgi:surfactin synthase thioesterase subunit